MNIYKANIGNKLDCAFGKATGDSHNLQRFMKMQSQLSKIGIYDDVFGSQIMTNFMNQALNSNLSGIISTTERVAVDSLLAGPGGFLQVRTILEGTKLITFIFYWFMLLCSYWKHHLCSNLFCWREL